MCCRSVVDALAVQPEQPVEEHARSDDHQAEDAHAREKPVTECGPQTEREAEDEDAGEVRGDLVVEPWARRCHSAEIADVVVHRAESGGLHRVGENDAGDEAHRRREPADRRQHVRPAERDASPGHPRRKTRLERVVRGGLDGASTSLPVPEDVEADQVQVGAHGRADDRDERREEPEAC